jgi:hypothetical protein
MKKISGRLQILKFLLIGLLGLGIVVSGGECQAYFNGAPAYDANYRPIEARMGIERYVDLSTMDIFRENDTWLKFTVKTVSAKEDAGTVYRDVNSDQRFLLFKVNKQTREAWVASAIDAEVLMAMAAVNDNIQWKYLNLNKAPAGYEMSSYNIVNICYKHKYGEYLNDSSGTAALCSEWYKGE